MDWDDSFQAIVDPERPVVCLTYPEGIAGQWNLFEADLVRALTALLAERLVGPEGASFDDWMWGRGLGIVTPHRAQRARIVAELQAAFPDTPVAAIRDAVDTVERFQGQERDVILASYAVGDPDTIAAEEEFLQDLNRFNVLATRPTSKLIVMVTDELVGHLAADIRTLRSSALLKQFTGTYCGSSAAIDVSYADPRRGEREVPLTLRWHT